MAKYTCFKRYVGSKRHTCASTSTVWLLAGSGAAMSSPLSASTQRAHQKKWLWVERSSSVVATRAFAGYHQAHWIHQ